MNTIVSLSYVMVNVQLFTNFLYVYILNIDMIHLDFYTCNKKYFEISLSNEEQIIQVFAIDGAVTQVGQEVIWLVCLHSYAIEYS